MDTKKNPKKKMKIVKKPYVKGSIVDASTVKDALRFFGGTVIMMLAFLLRRCRRQFAPNRAD